MLDSDVTRARELREALRLMVRRNAEPEIDAEAAALTVSRMAASGRLTVEFEPAGAARLVPSTPASTARWPRSRPARSRRWRTGRGSACGPACAATGRATTARATCRRDGARCATAETARRRAPTGAEERRRASRASPTRAAPVRVAWARIRARPGRGALVAAGVALATAAAAGIAGGGKITADLELRRSLEALPRADRSFSATWLGAPPAAGYGAIDREATRTLAGIQPGDPARTVSYPELNLNGQLVSLGAVDDRRPLAPPRLRTAAPGLRPRAVRGHPGGRRPGGGRVREGRPARRRRAGLGPLPFDLTRSAPPPTGRRRRRRC